MPARTLRPSLISRLAWASRYHITPLYYLSHHLPTISSRIASFVISRRALVDVPIGVGYVWLGRYSQHCRCCQCWFGYPPLPLSCLCPTSLPLSFCPSTCTLIVYRSGNAIKQFLRKCTRASSECQPGLHGALGRHGHQNSHSPLCCWSHEQPKFHWYPSSPSLVPPLSEYCSDSHYKAT